MSLDIFAQYFSEQQKEDKPGPGKDLFAEYIRFITSMSGQDGTQGFPGSLKNDEFTFGLSDKNAEPYDLAVFGGSVVLPEFGVLSCDVYSKNGKIASLNQGDILPSRQYINAKEQLVLPGIIDPHIHMGIVDSLANELQSETLSALLGGVTTAGLFLGADLANAENFTSISEQVNRLSYINILPHFVVANHEQIAALPMVIKTLGVRSFKVYLHGVPGLIESKDDSFVVDTMKALKSSGERCVLCVHTENHSLIMSATEKMRSNVGDRATLLDWAETHPEISEEEAVIRIAYFAQKMEQLTYIVHISSEGAVEKLREIRKTNPYVLCETVSPYLMIEPERARDFSAKMEPPIRGGRHTEALWQGLKDNVIDTIGTDNVSWNLSQKNLGKSVWEALPGYPAMATHLPSVLTGGILNRGFDLASLTAKMSAAPAKAFGIYPKKGTLLPGTDADMVLVDLNNIKKVDSKKLRSRSEYSIFEGQSFTGWPTVTIVAGQVVAADGQAVSAPNGSMLR